MKERIEHRKPWTLNENYTSRNIPEEVVDTWYKFEFNRDFVLKDNNGEIIAISSNKKRLRNVLKKKL